MPKCILKTPARMTLIIQNTGWRETILKGRLWVMAALTEQARQTRARVIAVRRLFAQTAAASAWAETLSAAVEG